VSDLRPTDRDEFMAMVRELREREGYAEPAAFGIGLATVADADGSVLDTWYGAVNLEANLGSAAVVADVVGHDGGAATHRLGPAELAEVLATTPTCGSCRPWPGPCSPTAGSVTGPCPRTRWR